MVNSSLKPGRSFFGRGDATLSPDDVQAMVQGIEPYNADIPPLDPRDLKNHVMRTANSAPGEDAYPLILLQAMPITSVGVVD